MSYSNRSSVNGSQASAAATSSFNITLTAPPIAGNWITIALIPNDIVNCYTTSITINGIALTQLDSGYASTGQYIPEVWGAPYQAGMAGQTVVTINWANGLGLSRAMYAVALLWAGASATPTTNYANFRTSTSGGLIDGASGTNNIGSTVSSNGAVSDANGVVNFSRVSIPTSYDTQQEPFILATIMRGTNVGNPITYVVQSGTATITNGVITTSGQPAGTVLVNSNISTSTASGIIALTGISGGNIGFSWTSLGSGTGTQANTPAFLGCSVPSTSDFYTSTVIPQSTFLLVQTVTAGSVVALTNSGTFGAGGRFGFVDYSLSQIPMAGGFTGTARLSIWGGTSTGLPNTNAYVHLRATNGGTATGGSVLLTFVPATRNLSRVSKVVESSTNLSIKKRLFSRLVQATLSVTSSLTRFRTLLRQVKLSQSKFISVSKISRFNRISRVSNVDTSSTLRRRNITRATLVSLSLQSVTSRFNRFNRLVSSTLSSRGSSTRSQKFNRRASSTQVQTASLTRVKRFFRFISTSLNFKSTVLKSRSVLKFLTSGLFPASKLISNKQKLRSVVSSLVNSSKSSKRRLFNKRATATQSVTATVIRNRKYGRVVVATSSYTIGTTRTHTLIRRAIASSNTAVKVSKAYGRYYLVKSSSTIKMATSGAAKLIISSTALWNSTKNTTTRLVIKSSTLVNEKIFASSNDWQQPNNGQPLEGNETEVFDDVPKTINEVDDVLGTDIVPFHE